MPKEKTGYKDVNNVDVYVGDEVHCWDGYKDQSEITASLTGLVTKVVYSDEIQFEVDGNNLALGCAEYFEVLPKQGG